MQRVADVWWAHRDKTKVTKKWDSDSVDTIGRMLESLGALKLQQITAQHHKADCLKWKPSPDQFLKHAEVGGWEVYSHTSKRIARSSSYGFDSSQCSPPPSNDFSA